MFHQMVSVADMLRWKFPPLFILTILLLRFGTPDSTPTNTLDFVEVFSGQAEISKAMRNVSKLYIGRVVAGSNPKKLINEIGYMCGK